MTPKGYSDEQIAFSLRQAENGTTVEKVCRKLGVSEATFIGGSSNSPGWRRGDSAFQAA